MEIIKALYNGMPYQRVIDPCIRNRPFVYGPTHLKAVYSLLEGVYNIIQWVHHLRQPCQALALAIDSLAYVELTLPQGVYNGMLFKRISYLKV